jgi:hypothetical protein
MKTVKGIVEKRPWRAFTVSDMPVALLTLPRAIAIAIDVQNARTEITTVITIVKMIVMMPPITSSRS